MKRLLINTVLLLSCCKYVAIQTRPHQSYMLPNPSATGIEDYGQLRTGVRQQWMGVEGVPFRVWLAGYVYHLPLSSSLVLSAGFSRSVERARFDLSGNICPGESGDPATLIPATTSKKYQPDPDVGLLLNGSRFFAYRLGDAFGAG